MEEHRLKEMPIYNPELFNDLYHRTLPLKRKLAREIDSRRFGVDQEEVMSWFDVKLLFVFQKHQHEYAKDDLLAMIIKGLQNFKCRILRKAYTVKFSQTILEYEVDLHDQEDSTEDLKAHYSALLNEFMKAALSPDGYTLFDLQINPPPYVLRKLRKKGIDSIHKIPDDIILRYFGYKLCPNSYKFLEALKQEIKNAIKLAKIHFGSN